MRVVRFLWRWAVAIGALLLGGRSRAGDAGREIPPPPDDRTASRAVVALLLCSALAFAGFAAGYLLDLSNPFLGGALALGFACAAAAAITAGMRLVPQVEATEQLSAPDPDARDAVGELIREGGEGVSRRGLFVAAGCAGCAAAAAFALPAASLGPLLDTEALRRSPWRSGRRLVDSDGEPLLADDIAVGSFASAFPEGADPERIDAPVVIARLRPEELSLPTDRAGWAPEGFVAYSKICTHAACAISLFDYPTFAPAQPSPRFVCPCHYSAFDAGGGGAVLAGPAGRPLPQLPLRIEADRTLVAAGGFSGPPGPSWSGVRGS